MKLKNLLVVSAFSALGAFMALGCGDESKATADDKTNIQNLGKTGISPPPTPGAAPGSQPAPGTPVSGVVEDP